MMELESESEKQKEIAQAKEGIILSKEPRKLERMLREEIKPYTDQIQRLYQLYVPQKMVFSNEGAHVETIWPKEMTEQEEEFRLCIDKIVAKYKKLASGGAA